MRDNVRSLVGHRQKIPGEGSGKPFYEDNSGCRPSRIDLRQSDGIRRSVAYGRIQQIEFWPQSVDAATDAGATPVRLETIYIDCPNLSRTEISGTGLQPLYELLVAESVGWIREAASEEVAVEGAAYIEGIYHLALTDWRLDWEALKNNRQTMLGSEDPETH